MADREAYDWMVKDGRLDPKVKPPTDENFALAADPVKNKEAVAAWQASKATAPAVTAPVATAVKPLADPVSSVEEEKPEVSTIATPGEDITPEDTPAAKAIKTETILPLAVTPSTYKPMKKEPDFWEQALSVAQQAGKSIVSVLADFTAGYAGKETPSAIKARQAHDLAMEGQKHLNDVDLLTIQNKHAENLASKAAYIAKEMESIRQSFEQKQNALKMKHDVALAAPVNANARESIESAYTLAKQTLDYQQEIALIQFRLGLTTDAATKGGAQGIKARAGLE
jgi:hypothetical protein